MRCEWFGLAIGVILCAPCVAIEMRADTARLTSHLGRFRGHKVYEFSAGEYASLQAEYLSWIDSRLKAGQGVKTLNVELRAAKLLSNGPETISDEFDRTYAGFLGEIQIKRLDGASDLFAIKTGIYTGGYCNFDETIVVYRRKPFQRVGRINAESSYTHGYYLFDMAVGKDDAVGGRIIASEVNPWSETRS